MTYELIFYAFFLLAFFSRRSLLAASVGWSLYLLAVLTGYVMQADRTLPSAVSNPIILEFFCGALAAWLFVRIPTEKRWAILSFGVVFLGLVIVFWIGERALLGPPLSLIVLAAAMTPYRTPDRMTNALIFLGAASYAIYLVHSPVISILARALQPLEQRALIFCACALNGTALGIVYHLFVEKPALQQAQRFGPKVKARGAMQKEADI